MICGTVKVQVCGQLEAIQLECVNAASLTTAIERRFEVRPPFLFLDREGRQLQSDESLVACAELGGTVHVKLTEGVLHDFSRRIDQFRHLQWGYMVDQLQGARHDQTQQKEDARAWRSLVEQEQGARESQRQEAQRHLEELKELVRSERQVREQALQGLEARLGERQAAQRQSLERQGATLAAAQRGVAETAQGLEDERRARDQALAGVAADAEDLRRQMQVELADREAGALRLHKEVATAQASAETASAAWKAEALELRQQVSSLRQALSLEQRERTAADADCMGSVSEAQRMTSQEASERQSEAAILTGRFRELEAALDVARIDSKRACSDVSHQLSLALDSLKERQAMQVQEVGDLAQVSESLRKSLEQEVHDRELLGTKLERFAHDAQKRYDDEVRARDAEISKLLRAITEESDRRQEGDRKLGRMVAAFEEGTDADSDLRAQESKDLAQAVEQCRAALHAEQAQRSALHEEFTEKLAQQRRLLGEEQKQRLAQVAELSERTAGHGQGMGSGEEDLLARLDRETRQREAAHASLSRSLSELSEALAQALHGRTLSSESQEGSSHGRTDHMVRTACSALRTECLALSSGSLQELRLDLQADVRAQTEALAKLREDCKEAMQREIRARMDRDASLQDALDHEGKVRAEAVDMLDAAAADIRQGLETHTHELHVEGPPVAAQHPQRHLGPGQGSFVAPAPLGPPLAGAGSRWA